MSDLVHMQKYLCDAFEDTHAHTDRFLSICTSMCASLSHSTGAESFSHYDELYMNLLHINISTIIIAIIMIISMNYNRYRCDLISRSLCYQDNDSLFASSCTYDYCTYAHSKSGNILPTFPLLVYREDGIDHEGAGNMRPEDGCGGTP